MSSARFLAIDLGAESGRVIAASVKRNSIDLKEIHRFPNRQVSILSHLYWDVPYLFDEIKNGLRQAVVREGREIGLLSPRNQRRRPGEVREEVGFSDGIGAPARLRFGLRILPELGSPALKI